MSISRTASSSPSNPFQTYAHHVGAAARHFAAALCAFEPANTRARVTRGRPPVGDELSLYRLYRLACHSHSCDRVSPALAHELRMIAARG
jgi:hypothetical protein